MNPELKRCYSCGEVLGEFGWIYTGTSLIICDPCHRFTKRKESRRFVEVDSNRSVFANAFNHSYVGNFYHVARRG